jgi:MSHA biogenesis protein MshQ
MKRLGLSVLCAALVLAMAGASRAATVTLTSNIAADDEFDFYVSSNDAVAGTYIGSGSGWPLTFNFSTPLTSGNTYYLHVKAWDVGFAIAAFLGDFSLSGTSLEFSNGSQNLLTNTTNWQVSATGFGVGYTTPTVAQGTNGVGPWGFHAGIAAGAEWIWTNNGFDLGTRYFSTPIRPSPVPLPAAFPAGLAVLGTAGLLRRTRRA